MERALNCMNNKGVFNVQKKELPVTRSSMPSYEEYCAEIRDLWDSRWLSNRGLKHRQFELELKKFLQSDNIALFANGHVALEVTINAFNLKGEVITTPFTHCSTTHAIVRNGLAPVFCDINERNYTIDADKIERYVNDRTCAIIATHVYGLICDVDKIEELARKYNLKVIYDAAHAFGETLNGKSIAGFGDAVMFSCHATKVFHTIEGGITAFSDDRAYSKIDYLTNFGFTSHENVDFISTNARMNEFEAVMGICNLRHIKHEIEMRKKAAARYNERLCGNRGIKLITTQNDVEMNYSYFPVFFDGYKENRDEIQEKLKKENIFARKYFYPLTPELRCYTEKYGGLIKNTPVAKHASETVLTLPLYAELSADDVDRICDIILE